MASVLSAGDASAIAAPITVSGTIEPTRLSLAYRLGLVVVAIAMLLLPLLYLGLIAVVGTGVGWHLASNTWILHGRGGSQWRGIVYAAPAVVGLVLMFFMVKPILARPAKEQEPLPILPDQEPWLFAFIEEICRQVRAPVPRRVQVNCQVNASASFMPGRFGVLKKDLVLTIGLPLAAGLSVRQLGGVLAHEFGHFAQGGGMRLTALVRAINGWFARVVYQRDQWDETLERWSKEADWRLSIVLLMARGAVWASRRVLSGLMMGGHAISCFMMRQMEYDADSYEIKLAGSDAFTRTSTRMRELGLGTHFGYNDLREGLRTRTLPSNLPVFLIQRSSCIPDEVLIQVRDVPAATTGIFDTHPSDADRVKVAEAAAVTGVLVGGDAPATQLFRNFETLSAEATRHHYEHDLGLNLDGLTFVSTDVAIQESRNREEGQQAIDQFFGDRVSVYRPLHLSITECERLSATELRTALGVARDTMTAAGEQLSEQYRRYELIERKRENAFCAQQLLGAGFSAVNATDFDLTQGTAEDAISTEARLLEELREWSPALDRFEEVAAHRVSCGVCLALISNGARESGADTDLEPRRTLTEPPSMIVAFNAVASAMPHVHELRRFVLAENLLEHNRADCGQPEQLNRAFTLVDRHIAARRDLLRDSLSNVACPPSFSATPMTLAVWCGLSAADPPVSSPEVLSRVVTLYFAMLGQLAAIALQIEAGPQLRPMT